MYFPKLLRIAIIPYFQSVKINDTTYVKQRTTFYEDSLAKVICEKLRVPCIAVAPEDREWGWLLPDGNWTGMMGMLHRNEADLIIFQLSITEERMQIIDFSFPYHVDKMVFATRKLKGSSRRDSFLKPFSLKVWLSSIGCVITLPVICYIFLKRRKQWNHFRNAYEYLLLKSPSPVSTVEFFFKTSWKLFEVLIRWCYSALLLSFLTYPSLSGVRSISELAKAALEGKYQCISAPGPFLAGKLLSSDDSNLQIIGQSVKQNEGHLDFDEVLSNLTQYKNPAFIGSESRFKGTSSKYFVSDDGFFPDYRAIGIRQDFCCKTQLDSIVHEIWAAGIYEKLYDNFIRRKVNEILWRPTDRDKKGDVRPLSLADFQGVFILLLAGYACATAVFFFELVLGKLKR